MRTKLVPKVQEALMTTQVLGSIPAIIRNDDKLYVGTLNRYFRMLFFAAPNANFPYHNFRHMMHVTWRCHQACVHYRKELTKRKIRNLLVGAMFHDFGHSGKLGNDDNNIARAIWCLKQHALPEDRGEIEAIAAVIRATRFPYIRPSCELDLSGQIIRDADMSQGFSVAWIQQVIFGLASEWGKEPLEVLRMQEPFLGSLKFETKWAKKLFPQSTIDEKIKEARELLALLEPELDARLSITKN